MKLYIYIYICMLHLVDMANTTDMVDLDLSKDVGAEYGRTYTQWTKLPRQYNRKGDNRGELAAMQAAEQAALLAKQAAVAAEQTSMAAAAAETEASLQAKEAAVVAEQSLVAAAQAEREAALLAKAAAAMAEQTSAAAVVEEEKIKALKLRSQQQRTKPYDYVLRQRYGSDTQDASPSYRYPKESGFAQVVREVTSSTSTLCDIYATPDRAVQRSSSSTLRNTSEVSRTPSHHLQTPAYHTIDSRKLPPPTSAAHKQPMGVFFQATCRKPIYETGVPSIDRSRNTSRNASIGGGQSSDGQSRKYSYSDERLVDYASYKDHDPKPNTTRLNDPVSHLEEIYDRLVVVPPRDDSSLNRSRSIITPP